MRLIDADMVLETCNSFKGMNRMKDIGIKLVNEIVGSAPTVDAERHGHWEKLYTNNYKCSVCGSWWTDDGDTYLIEFNYCPNCGAKMDRVEE